jgi:tetratricopeptide (TPR) repeat protein
MKTLFYLGLAGSILVLTTLHLSAMDPAKMADYQRRFQEGVRLDNEGKLKEAREVFLKITQEEPTARGSWFYAAFTSHRLGDYEKAADYISKFRELEPKDYKGLVVSIQVNQALRRSVKVEGLRRELWNLRQTGGTIPGLTDSKSYIRERFPLGEGNVVSFLEFFDYKQEPYFLYEAKLFNAEDDVQRHLVITFDKKQSEELQAKGDKYKGVEMLYFSEFVIKDGKAQQINVYRQEVERPSYDTVRKWILEAIKAPPAPLQIAPMQ